MSLVYGGEITLGALCPTVLSATAAATAEVQAQAAGAASLSASLSITPPTVATQITILTQFLAQLQASATLGLPSVSYDLSACAALSASLAASLSVLVALQALLGTGGVFAYTYAGAMNGLGAALTTEFATQYRDAVASSTSGNAVILVTDSSVTWTAMASFFAGA